MPQVARSPHDVLPRLYQAGLAAVAPAPAVRRALESLAPPPGPWTRILALGKAAVPMAVAAAETLRGLGHRVRDGLIVPARPVTLSDRALRVVAGNHPLPGRASAAAARAVGLFVADGRPGDLLVALVSGGTSSLIGAPVAGLSEADFRALSDTLIGAGLPIGDVNRVRRRFARWAGGRLGAALAPAQRIVLAISDVPGDRLADIGSGPFSADPDTAASLRAWLEAEGIWPTLPAAARALLEGPLPETPQAGDPRLEGSIARIVASNADALRGVAAAATRLGLRALVQAEPLAGEAAACGRALAARLLVPAADGEADCLVWGGETTVRLPPGHPGRGGRSQELALAAARALAAADGDYPALLAAGTDGIDGPTDAAGALVTPGTWARIQAQGRDPERDLTAHDSHPALDAAGALLRPGPTGTNVMDLAIGLRTPTVRG